MVCAHLLCRPAAPGRIFARPLRSLVAAAILGLLLGTPLAGPLVSPAAAQGPPNVLLKLEGHSGAVNGVEFLPGGLVATVSADQTVRLWDAATGKEVRRYEGHQGQILSLAVAPDGLGLVTGAQDNQIKLWDIPQAKSLRSFGGHEGGAARFVLSPDGQLVASVGADKTLRLWQTASGETAGVRTDKQVPKTAVAFRLDNQEFADGDAEGRITLWIPFEDAPQGTLGAHDGAVRGLAYHPNNQQLYSAGQDGTAKLWQLPLTPPRSVTGHTAPVTALVIAPNNQHILTGGVDKTLRLFDIQNRQLIRAFPVMPSALTSVAASPNSVLVAAADDAGRIQLWNYNDGGPQPLLQGHVGAVRSIAFHPDSQRIASAGDDGTVRIWTIQPLAPQSLAGHQGPIRAVASPPGGQQIATVSSDKSVQFWNPNGQSSRRYDGHQAEVQAVTYRADGGLVATGDAGGSVHVQSQDGGLQGILGASAGPITALAFHPTQQQLYTAGSEGTIKQWQLPLSPARQLGGHPEAVRAVAVTADGRFGLSCSNDTPVRLWDAATGNHIRNLDGLQGPVNALALSPDGNAVVGVNEAGGLKVWNLGDGGDLGQWLGHGGPAIGLAFHPSGNSIAVTGSDGFVRICALPKKPTEQPGEKSACQTAVVSRDGKLLALGGTKDGKPAVFLREATSGKILATLMGHESAITAVAFNREHTRLATGGADNTVRVWNISDAPFPQVALLKEHPTAITSVALSDDGGTVFSVAGGENLIRQWSTAEQKETKQITGHGGAVIALAVHGELLASGSADGTLRTWKVADGTPVTTISHGTPVSAIAFSPEGATLASGGEDKTVKLWTAATGAATRSFPPLEGRVGGIAFSPDNRRLAATDGGNTRSWLVDGTPLDRLQTGNILPRGIAYGEDSLTLVTPVPDGVVKAWPAAVLQTVSHPGGITAAAFTADGTSLVTGGVDKMVRVATVADGQPAGVLAGASEGITSLAVSAQGRVYAAALDRKILEWTVGGAGMPEKTTAVPAIVRALRLSGDGRRLVTGGDDQTVVVWDAATGLELERFRGHTAPITSLACSTEGRTLISGSQDKQARLQTISAQRIFAGVGPAGSAPIQDLAILPGTFRMVASVQGERQLRMWQPDGQPVAALATAGPVARFLVAASNQQLIAADTEGRIQFWSLPDLQPVRTLETKAPLTNLALSPDGLRLAVGDGMSQVRVFATNGDCRQLEQFAAPAAVVDLAFAGDAQKPTLLVGTPTPTPTIHPLALQRIFEAHPGGATGIAFNNPGDQLLTCGADGKVHAWKTQDGERLRTYEGAEAGLTCVAFSRDNARVIAGSLDKTARVWSAGDAKLQVTLPHKAAVRAVSPNHENTRIATAGDDQLVHAWDLATARELQSFEGHAGPALGVAFASDNRTIVSGGSDQSVRLWTLAATRVVAAHEGEIVDLFQTNGGGSVVTLGTDGKVRNWDANLNPGRTYDGWEGPARSLAVRFDNQQFAVGLESGQVFIGNFGDGSTIRKLPTKSAVTSLAFSQDNQKLACTTADKRLLVYATQDWALQQETPMLAAATDLVFSADHRRLWTTDDAGKVSEWAVTAPKEVRSYQGHGGAVYGLAYTGDGKTIVSCSADQTLRTWDVLGGNQKQQFGGHQAPVYGLARSPDSALVCSTSGDKSIRLWNLQAGNQLTQLPSGDQTAYSVAFHPDGRTVAAAGADKKIRIFDVLSGTLQRTLEGHPDYIHRVVYNPGGTRLLSCGYSGRVFFWNPDGTLAAQHRLSDVLNAASYSPDGAKIVVGGSSGHAYVIETPAAAR